MLQVTIIEGKERRTLSTDKQSVMIGRAPANDIPLESDGVSRYHARFTLEGDNVLLQDLNSTNGTFVNSEQITKCIVTGDDQIAIGKAFLKVTYLVNNKHQTAIKVQEEKPNKPNNKSNNEPDIPTSVSTIETNESKKSSDQESFYLQSLKSFLLPIWNYVTDESVSEIMINGPTEIYTESKGRLVKTNAVFTTDQLNAAVLNIAQYVGRRVSEEEPYLDARLPDGSRVAVLLPPCSRKGVSIAIRKFAKEQLTIQKLKEFGSFSDEMVIFLEAAVILKKNIIISGGTSSGKTSLLNVLSSLIPQDERIITIEDSAELQLIQDHVLPMETKPADKKGRGQVTIRDLVKASLRMRPDRIVVGEIRGGEALDLLQAMNTGHSGSMATLHASSPLQALSRLETLALFSGLDIPMTALREQVSSAVDLVVQASRLPDHSRKVTYITEVCGLDTSGNYIVNDIFRFVSEGRSIDGEIKGTHVATGYQPSILEEMKLFGLEDAVKLFENTKKPKTKKQNKSKV
jgi:pilus assembly protein CpaF